MDGFTTDNNIPAPGHNRLAILDDHIKQRYQYYKKAAQDVVTYAIEMGRFLREVRELVEGQFMAYVEARYPFSYQTAINYIELANTVDTRTLSLQTVLSLGVKGALKAIRFEKQRKLDRLSNLTPKRTRPRLDPSASERPLIENSQLSLPLPLEWHCPTRNQILLVTLDSDTAAYIWPVNNDDGRPLYEFVCMTFEHQWAEHRTSFDDNASVKTWEQIRLIVLPDWRKNRTATPEQKLLELTPDIELALMYMRRNAQLADQAWEKANTADRRLQRQIKKLEEQRDELQRQLDDARDQRREQRRLVRSRREQEVTADEE